MEGHVLGVLNTLESAGPVAASTDTLDKVCSISVKPVEVCIWVDVYWISFEASGQLWNVGDDCGVRLLTFLAMGVVDTCTSGSLCMSSACFR